MHLLGTTAMDHGQTSKHLTRSSTLPSRIRTIGRFRGLSNRETNHLSKRLTAICNYTHKHRNPAFIIVYPIDHTCFVMVVALPSAKDFNENKNK